MLIALELYHRIDDVFQKLRSGQRSFFVDVPDQNHRNATVLGKMQQRGSALSYLRNAAGRAVYILGSDGLYGVDDNELGLYVVDLCEYIL